MKKKIIILVCLLIYLWSVGHTYNTFSIAYSKGGRWQNISPSGADVLVVLVPVLNTAWSLQHSYKDMYDDRPEPDNSFYEKLFQIKK